MGKEGGERKIKKINRRERGGKKRREKFGIKEEKVLDNGREKEIVGKET